MSSVLPTAKLELTLAQVRTLIEWEAMAAEYCETSGEKMPKETLALWRKLDAMETKLANETRDAYTDLIRGDVRLKRMDMRKIRRQVGTGE